MYKISRAEDAFECESPENHHARGSSKPKGASPIRGRTGGDDLPILFRLQNDDAAHRSQRAQPQQVGNRLRLDEGHVSAINVRPPVLTRADPSAGFGALLWPVIRPRCWYFEFESSSGS